MSIRSFCALLLPLLLCAQLHAEVPAHGIKTSSLLEEQARVPRAKEKLAIVYMAQMLHSSYGRNSAENLVQSLQLLAVNVLPWNPADVIIFHEGDFTASDQVNITAGQPNVRFQLLSRRFWHLPKFMKGDDPQAWHDAGYSVGYRHMIRWYAIKLFEYMHEAGYEWVMRFDEESYVWSQIKYSMTEMMEKKGAVYAYRMLVKEWPGSAVGFIEATRAYYALHGVEPKFLLKECNPQSLEGMYSGLGGHGWSRIGYYNNFFLTKVSFWNSPEVMGYLNFLDRTGGIYFRRWNDVLFQTAAVQTFLTEEQVHKFDDWTYEHATLRKDRLIWGGIVAGTEDSNAEATVAEFVRQRGGPLVCVEGAFENCEG